MCGPTPRRTTASSRSGLRLRPPTTSVVPLLGSQRLALRERASACEGEARLQRSRSPSLHERVDGDATRRHNADTGRPPTARSSRHTPIPPRDRFDLQTQRCYCNGFSPHPERRVSGETALERDCWPLGVQEWCSPYGCLAVDPWVQPPVGGAEGSADGLPEFHAMFHDAATRGWDEESFALGADVGRDERRVTSSEA
jgi:hypothetical protein